MAVNVYLNRSCEGTDKLPIHHGYVTRVNL
jgi:hypothetical protein